MRACRTYFCLRAGAPLAPNWMSRCSQKYPGPDCTLNREFFRRSTIWSCGCGSVASISPAFSAWNNDAVDGMYRKTTRSTLAFGPAAYAAFLARVSCVPFCQLTNLNGPLAMPSGARQRSWTFFPTSLWAGIGDTFATSASQAAYERPFLKVTVTAFPFTRTFAMSSQPSREVMSQRGSMIVRWVARKSFPVSWRPSLHFALALYLKLTVSGFD